MCKICEAIIVGLAAAVTVFVFFLEEGSDANVVIVDFLIVVGIRGESPGGNDSGVLSVVGIMMLF